MINSKIMKTGLSLLIAGGLSLSAAYADCNAPKPPKIPDGKTASKDEMFKAIKYIRNGYIAGVREYQACIKNEEATVGEFATEDQKAKWLKQYDYGFDLESFYVGKINQAVRDYKATAKKAAVSSAVPAKSPKTNVTKKP